MNEQYCNFEHISRVKWVYSILNIRNYIFSVLVMKEFSNVPLEFFLAHFTKYFFPTKEKRKQRDRN